MRLRASGLPLRGAEAGNVSRAGFRRTEKAFRRGVLLSVRGRRMVVSSLGRNRDAETGNQRGTDVFKLRVKS